MEERYFIEIAYDGTAYHGWQIQPNAISVQEKLNSCLSTILREEIHIQGAGRTDTGVHARQTFAHFDVKKTLDLDFINRCNSILPADIQLINYKKVNSSYHSRFDAVSRTYEYIISTAKDPFYINKAFYFFKDLDLDLMNKASQLLLLEKDFTSFSKLHTQTKTNDCTLSEAIWHKKNHFLIFNIKADRFLRNMVRSIVGTLIEVGLKKITIDDFKIIIASKDRKNAGFSVPACGLYLKSVEYPKTIWQ